MQIKIEDKLLELLKERSENNITITLKGNPSCKGFEFNPLVRNGLPKEEKKDAYSLYREDGINIYLDKNIEAEGPENLYIHFNRVGLTENFFADFS